MYKHMKIIIYISLVITLTLFLMSCAPQQSELLSTETLSEDQLALRVLENFLESLHNGKYDNAAQLYGGTFETMIDQNPGINPNDHSTLLRNACTINGAQCLQVKSAGLDKTVSDTKFVFKVDFFNADGTLFVLGPCCGGNETDSPSRSIFFLSVMKVDKNKFAVMDMPPYSP
jgi:hypothetical protein